MNPCDSWNSLEYRLHARVGVLQGIMPAVQLWYALRALDVSGSGKVSITTGDMERQLGKGRTTIWRYLKDKTFFRSHVTVKGVVTVYLHGLRSVCRALHLDSIGPIGFNVGLKSIQRDSAAIGAQSLQQSSLYLALLSSRKDKKVIGDPLTKGKVADVLDASLLEESSFITGGATSIAGECLLQGAAPQCIGTLPIKTVSGAQQEVHMLRASATLYGASLEGIAKLLRVCSKTVSKSLMGTRRIRQAQQVPLWEYNALQVEAADNFGRSEEAGFYSYHKKYGSYRLYTYLYYPYYPLCSQRVLKSHINPSLKVGGRSSMGCAV